VTATAAHDCDERRLMAAVAARNEDAFHALWQQYRRYVRTVAMNIVQDADVADELVNDVFAKIWQHANQFAGSAKIQTWLHSITYRAALNCMRTSQKRGSQYSLISGHLPTTEDDNCCLWDMLPDAAASTPELRDDLRQAVAAIAALPPLYADAWWAAWGNNSGPTDGLAAGTYRSRLSRAREAIKCAVYG
jgi:RNA polymerase sigma factor (sigma-70 family)